jgi:hypothetical protein
MTTNNLVVSMDAVDRLVYFEVFNYVMVNDKKAENNPYIQGSTSWLAWEEGCRHLEIEKAM